MKSKIETKGLARYVGQLHNRKAKAAVTVNAGLKATASRGTAYKRKKKTESQTPTLAALNKATHRSAGMVESRRSEGANIRIWNTQKKAGRNPFHYNIAQGHAIWRRGAQLAARGNVGAMERTALVLAKRMLEWAKENVSSGNGIAPNKGRYAMWKKKRWPGKPALVLSGQLIASLKPVVGGK